MKLAFFGSPEFAVPSLQALVDAGHEICLVVTQPARRRGRSKRQVPTEVRARAELLGLPVLEAGSLRDRTLDEPILSCGAELGVVVAYGCLIPRRIFRGFPQQMINLHGSLLPAYRGAAPIQWALIRGETETGVSVQRIVRRLDAGPLFASRSTAIGRDETAGALFERLAPLGAQLLCEVVADIEAGRAQCTPQDASKVSQAPKLSKADGSIDWTQPAGAVFNFIRGVTPWPGARTFWQAADGATHALTILQAEVCDQEGAAGTLLSPASALTVACGAGSLRLRRLTPAGKKPMDAGAFARGRPLREGDRFAGSAQP